ncbi:glycosyltransferase family 4 protein [Candidatus Roizmanbacteria bacterium]|nr:glycosyltransferase family 4 protein [Candidatus Roizmanbacteria bacterium]
MRIGIDARLWNETGIGRYIRNLVENLQKIDKKNEYVLFVKTGFKDRSFGFDQDKSLNWKVVETAIHWHSFEEQIKFPSILNKENLDLMHFPYFSLPIFYKKPFVVTIHDLIINNFPTGKASTLPYPLYLLKRMGYSSVLQHAVRNSRKIIVPLNAVKDDVLGTFGVSEDKIAVTYEGVSEMTDGKLLKANPSVEKYFLYVGNAYPHKNLERLVEAFIEFKKIIKTNIQLLLVGKNDYFYKYLRAKVNQEKIEGLVFKHDLSDQELFELYKNANMFISASLMEGFGLPPLEAMSASCPVLLSDIPSFREVCKDAAFYFDPYSINSIKQQMELVYNLGQKAREEKIKKGLERIKYFSWQKMAEQTLKVYENSV